MFRGCSTNASSPASRLEYENSKRPMTPSPSLLYASRILFVRIAKLIRNCLFSFRTDHLYKSNRTLKKSSSVSARARTSSEGSETISHASRYCLNNSIFPLMPRQLPVLSYKIFAANASTVVPVASASAVEELQKTTKKKKKKMLLKQTAEVNISWRPRHCVSWPRRPQQ